MFSSSVRNLPSCSDYYGAVRVWQRAHAPRSKNWREGTRPLKDSRSTHYAVIRDGDKIVFRLHQTNVVEWHNENSFTLDSNYDSISTREFAYRYTPGGVGFTHMREEGYVVALGEQRFCRGRHTFEKKDGAWVCVSEMYKPKRTVLQPEKMREVQAATREVCEWVKGIWAISGDDGSHPWMGKPYERSRIEFYLEELSDPERREAFVTSLIPEARLWSPSGGLNMVYAKFDAKQLCTKINEYFYKQLDCYIRIDYDAPIPRAEKKNKAGTKRTARVLEVVDSQCAAA